jgi:autotransporter strand-loop-strand O-heptosyltransferase
MKIINVTPGLIPIPPNGWGAVEKIIWENHNNLLALGHDSHITYLDEVPADADIVHIHVANLALIAHSRGIPYYFTCHDHHAYLYGKNSPVYKENLEAMRHAIKAFVPAKYLVEYFENIPEYFSHGVNTQYFYPSDIKQEHKLLCVANNGYIHNQSEDRKGFGIAIEAARGLNLPITVAGPSNNKKYFEAYPPTYDKLTILYDLTEKELQDLYRSHTVFVHPSETEAGHPNLTLLEALASGLPVVGTLEAGNRLGGMLVTGRDVVDVTLGIQEVILQYEQYKHDARAQANKLSWYNRTQELINIYTQDTPMTMKTQLLQHYTTTVRQPVPPRLNIRMNSIDGMFVEIGGRSPRKYKVEFINTKTEKVEFATEIHNNCWAKCNIKYHVDWDIVVTDMNTNIKFSYPFTLTGKKVYIALDSRSLGDTLAWMPYVEEFRKKHNCTVVCSTFNNALFRDTYSEIEFTEPGDVVHGITAMYKIGLYYYEDGSVDYYKNPIHPITVPLQKIASDILGLEYKEIRPKLNAPQIPQDDKLVTIAIHSTAQAKYWNNPTGWQEVVNWLNGRGYTVKLLSQEGDGYMGNAHPTGIIQHPAGPMDAVMAELKKSKLFIGLGSGLSWLSWALGTPTMIISGFSEPFAEMQDCIRIDAPAGKCRGCYNRVRLNGGDWNWCPDHKGTPRQFECSKSITAEMVIKELEKHL